MTTILVWVLVTAGGYNSNNLTYSPPMADLESCQRVQGYVKDTVHWSQCIQIRIVK